MARYRLGRRLAAGGMAEVYVGSAVGAGGFTRAVAIKRVLPQHAQDVFYQALFLREARRMAAVHHPNVVEVLDLGGFEGAPCMVLELVDGENLRTVLKAAAQADRALRLAEAVHITAEVAAGLAHAHAARSPDGIPLQLVHRDVNPTNILISATGEVKLADFGVAWAADGEAHEEGVVKGKPGYLSPEQARGERPDQRSDVFLLGLLLHELLTGTRLFKGLSFAQAINRIRTFQPRLMERSASIPPELWELLCHALEPEPSLRLATAQAFSDTLRDYLFQAGLRVGPRELATTFRALFPDRPSLCDEGVRTTREPVTLESSWRFRPPPPLEVTPAFDLSVPFVNSDDIELLEETAESFLPSAPWLEELDALDPDALEAGELDLEIEAQARALELLALERRRREDAEPFAAAH